MNYAVTEKSLAGRRILVVEDELLVADEIARSLRHSGVDAVNMAPSVPKALALIKSGPAFDAAVIDLNLAGEMAYPVVDALAARATPFIFATAYSRATLPDRYQHAPHCAKPVRRPELIRQLLGALGAGTGTAPLVDEHRARSRRPAPETGNALMQRLGAAAERRLTERASRAALPLGKVLRSPGLVQPEVLFPLSGMISISRSLRGGEAIETHLLGREGALGLDAVSGFGGADDWATVTASGVALHVEVGLVREVLSEDAAARSSIQRYQAELFDEMKQRVACSVAHALPQRLAGWLLRCRARVGSDAFAVTQEHLGQALGAQRTTISTLAHQMKAAGVIAYSRGGLIIRDLRRLEEIACPCHRDADPANRLCNPVAGSLDRSPPAS